MRTELQRRAVARARKITSGLLVAGLAGVALVGVVATTASAAPPAQTTFVDEGFTGADAGAGYILPATESADKPNTACLTAVPTSGSNTGSIPTCVGVGDAEGNGALRLTEAALNQAGGVGAVQSVPITKGIDAVFDSYQYDGASDGNATADGIVFYLAATDPYNPSSPQQIGHLGGSLGYSASKTDRVNGLSNAYLGIGLDRYGNFVNSSFGGTGCTETSTTRIANSVTVRGPGNGASGYCLQATKKVTGSLSAQNVGSNRNAARVPVEIVINPTKDQLTAQQNAGVTVDPGTYKVIYKPIGGTVEQLSGPLPSLATQSFGIDPSWIDPATGYPYKLTYGWVAGTGGASDVHEVNYLRTTTAAGPVPVLTALPGGTTTVAHASSGTYTVTPTVSADGGSETQLVRTTTTFPTGVTPVVDAATGTGWTCSAVGQVVTCDQVAENRPAGTVLPQLSIPYTVSGAARTVTLSTVVASTDAEAITVTQDVQVQRQTSVVTASDATATVGEEATLTATVASGAKTGGTTPTGEVRFTDAESGAALCTAEIVDGTASCTVPTSEVGTTGITAEYLGDADHTGATDTAALVVAKVETAVTLAATPSPATYGQAVTLSVDGLDGADERVAAPTGTVEFREGSTVLCTATLPDTSCVTTTLPAGTHAITAVYSGDDLHAGSASVAVDLVVSKATATLTPGTGTPSDPANPSDPSSPSDPDTTVTVTHGETTTLDTPNVPEDATGTIDYVTDDGTVLCTATLPDTTCTVPDDLPGGTYRVHARYSGDDNYEPAEGEPFDLVVTAQPTELVASTDTTTAVVGTKVRLSASGLPAGATGTVTFTTADGTVLCTATLPETSCETDALPVGTNTVTVAYSGDASFAASSTTLEVVVEAAPVVEPGDDPTAPETAAPVPTDEPTTDVDPTQGATTAPAAGNTPVAGSGELAFTGSPVAIGTGVGLAAALLLAGLVLLMVRRTRSARATETPTE